MSEFLQEFEPQVRLAAFFGIFISMAVLEFLIPRWSRRHSRTRRWTTNGAIVLLDSVVVRLIFPAAAVGAAAYAESQGWGVFRLAGFDPLLAGILAFIILDFAVWLEHVVSHKWPILWRIHKVHHADPDLDTTTGLRFHPIEIVISMIWKAAIVLALGAPVVAVLLFEIVLNGAAMFNHGNIRLPKRLDAVLRLAIVTPDMHHIHHSVYQPETDSNYGFNLSLWDRIFGCYVDQPRGGHDGMITGLEEHQDEGPTQILWSLILPFRRKAGGQNSAQAR